MAAAQAVQTNDEERDSQAFHDFRNLINNMICAGELGKPSLMLQYGQQAIQMFMDRGKQA